MLKHIVFYRLKDYSEENCDKLCEMFMSMNGKVPMVVDVRAHKDVLRLERSFDVTLEIIFNSQDDIAEYQKDPYHVGTVKKYVHSVIKESASVDYIY